MSSIQPIKIYGKFGPNPPKIACLVAELDIPHEIIPTGFDEVKQPAFLAINPNGRMPAIYDPNTDITIWESGAIIEYLIERYDKDHRLSFAPGTHEYYHAKQWLFFQTTGQAPYFGQAYWFKQLHSEKIPSAIERYVKEINRVTGVLDGWLARQKTNGEDGPWLVGNKYSYADLSFLSWYKTILYGKAFEGDLVASDYPHFEKWIKNMETRPKTEKIWIDIAAHYANKDKE
ncbi:glutathione transferase 2 [Dendryphion nanum]|uniref:Glutathione transferase 2 n=1 Tax=Dendryphion nanum TaxID=256645 RepID=A0A9P9IHS0_9PLEO|nr:glutathione transferase 2 [Dendryphion nanum]